MGAEGRVLMDLCEEQSRGLVEEGGGINGEEQLSDSRVRSN